MTDTTPVPIASLSKSFTALAVMQLVDDGRVDLDVPVVRYLPEFMMADPRSTRITVRQLLGHTSGMADASFPEKSLPAPSSLQESVAGLREASLSADPGTKFQYHNPNYWVAARLVEVVVVNGFPTICSVTSSGPPGWLTASTSARWKRLHRSRLGTSRPTASPWLDRNPRGIWRAAAEW